MTDALALACGLSELSDRAPTLPLASVLAAAAIIADYLAECANPEIATR